MAKTEIPNNMRKVYQRFQRWRRSHTGRLPIPEPLWAAAAELAREHGVFPTAKALHLEYGKLKQQVEAADPVAKRPVAKAPVALRQAQGGKRRRTPVPRRARSAPAAFVELIAPRPGGSPECLVELEGPRGRMRMQFKGMATAELVALSRALWSGEA
ncbi:MAG: hypothetical protein ABSF71_11820 [Terriglobia bacterium]|jgi:hypothetical protein